MSSPLHKFLFSPPPSPPLAVGQTESNIFSTTRSLKPAVTGQADTFKLSVANPARGRSPSPVRNDMNVDVEAANAYEKPKTTVPLLSRLMSTRVRILQAQFLPRPLVRLLGFVLLLFGASLVLSHVVLPTVFPLEQSSAAVVHVDSAAAAEAAPVPPVVVQDDAAPIVHHQVVAPHPRSLRPEAHPLPVTHELLALQSFVLESRSNRLPGDVDASQPIDAESIIGARAASRLRGRGSPQEQAWLSDLTTDASTEIVLWFTSATPPHYALDGIISRHGHGRRPELISLSKRRDGPIIRDILKRLGHNVNEVPILVIGGEVFDASVERMDELRSNGQLAQKLAQIGWR